jgi:hypothetical protein
VAHAFAAPFAADDEIGDVTEGRCCHFQTGYAYLLASQRDANPQYAAAHIGWWALGVLGQPASRRKARRRLGDAGLKWYKVQIGSEVGWHT